MCGNNNLDLLRIGSLVVCLLLKELNESELPLRVQMRFWFLNKKQWKAICFRT